MVSGRVVNVGDYSVSDLVYPNETVQYNFLNNITFEISTDSLIDLEIEYENRIENRQIYFIINNTQSIYLNISSKISMGNFGIMKPPQNPKKRDFQYQYRYSCIFKIRTNISIDHLTIQSKKKTQFGLDPNKAYSLAIFESSKDSWQLISTLDQTNETESSLTSSITSLQANTDYYITFFEITEVFNNWIWVLIILISSVVIASIVILISKKDYFQYLKTRTVPIEKGAHRLSLEEVLENENRNKIIELILNEPGIHFNELLRRTEIAAGNLVWHLDILETYKVIGKKRIGKFIAYFPYYQKNPVSNIDLKLSKSKLTLEILEMIEKEPGLWGNKITKHFKVDHKTIQYHVNKLKELNLINFRKEGRKKKIYINLDSEYFQNSKEDNI
ncbi:MAG: winged helix-turn-helix transcriptional regulator [Promethearchaeota archaeon]